MKLFILIFFLLIFFLINKPEECVVSACLFSDIPESCVVDYLLLSQNARTEIYAVGDGIRWGIPNELTIKNKITKKEMAEFMDEKYVDDCFERNKRYLNWRNSILDVKKLSNSIGEEYLTLSVDFQYKLSN